MDEKKKYIMDMAQELFYEKGLKTTSIDDIVRKCKISKSTFYKYFSTKENLVYELMIYFNHKFFDITTLIDSKDNLNDKEKLYEKIKTLWKLIYSQSIFSSYITENLLNDQGESIRELRIKTRKNVIREYHNSLIKVYGDDIKPIIWDQVFIFDALIHEFIYIIRNKKEKIDPEFIAKFIINTLDVAFNGKKEEEALIKQGYFHYKCDVENEKITNELLFERKILCIREKINESTLSSRKRLLEAVEEILIEFSRKRYDSLQVEAMIAYLEKEESIKEEVKVLDYIRGQLNKEMS